VQRPREQSAIRWRLRRAQPTGTADADSDTKRAASASHPRNCISITTVGKGVMARNRRQMIEASATRSAAMPLQVPSGLTRAVRPYRRPLIILHLMRDNRLPRPLRGIVATSFSRPASKASSFRRRRDNDCRGRSMSDIDEPDSRTRQISTKRQAFWRASASRVTAYDPCAADTS